MCLLFKFKYCNQTHNLCRTFTVFETEHWKTVNLVMVYFGFKAVFEFLNVGSEL